MSSDLIIVGGGLAGCEAAARATKHGLKVELWEMRPNKNTPAHKSSFLAELVCSNSLRSDQPESAVGLLKEEMRLMGSIIMQAADACKVPAGKALAVDREKFASQITKLIEENPLITIKREEFTSLPTGNKPIVFATGPLSSDAIINIIKEMVDLENLYFYDAISPVIEFDSMNLDKIFIGDRYGTAGQGDYLNAPLEKDDFEIFYENLLQADETIAREFEEKKFFEACLPIEVMARRGHRTLLFGPLKPVGFINPQTGSRPYAIVQFRRENESGQIWNMVGFQTRLTRGAQEKVFRLIPGLENAKFARYGAIHRNTYLEAPKILDNFSRIKNSHIYIAGQLSGVEGYVESAAHGLWVGENAARAAANKNMLNSPPKSTALGALLGHLAIDENRKYFAPSNINFGLFALPPKNIHKKEKQSWLLKEARENFQLFLKDSNYAV